MSTIVFECGCWIMQSMYGNREIRSVGHCGRHQSQHSQDKTLSQMAEEIRRTAEASA